MITTATCFAPATLANIGPAFDILGLALHQPGDTVTAQITNQTELVITSITGDHGLLPLEVDKNTAGVAAATLLRDHAPYLGVSLTLAKGLPLNSGLGSSAASAAAAVCAVNALLPVPLDRTALVPYAMAGEQIACGHAHADNVAPALLGGIVLIRSYSPLDLIPLSFPTDLRVIVIMPNIQVRTSQARQILKHYIPLSTAVSQWGNIAALITGFLREDLELIGRALTDHIVEPERALLIPGFAEVKAAALSTGALGCSISGAGPAIFAFAANDNIANAVSSSMVSTFANHGIKSQSLVSAISVSGAQLVTTK